VLLASPTPIPLTPTQKFSTESLRSSEFYSSQIGSSGETTGTAHHPRACSLVGTQPVIKNFREAAVLIGWGPNFRCAEFPSSHNTSSETAPEPHAGSRPQTPGPVHLRSEQSRRCFPNRERVLIFGVAGVQSPGLGASSPPPSRVPGLRPLLYDRTRGRWDPIRSLAGDRRLGPMGCCRHAIEPSGW